MSIFGQDQLVDVQTPDGRTMRLPSSVADALGLSAPPPMAPAQPQQVTAIEYGGAGIPTTTTPLPVPAPPPLPPPPPNGRRHLGVGLPTQEEVAGPSSGAKAGLPVPTFTDEERASMRPPEPPPQPMTADKLRHTGYAGAYDAAKGAIDSQAAAGQATADLEAKQQAAFGTAYEERNKQLDQMFAQRAKDADADHAAIAAKGVAYDAAVKKYADSKIDRHADHPILAAISLALGALGSAMRNDGKNPALDALMASIDRKVAGQQADIDKQGKSLGMQKEQIGMLREQASDRLAMNSLMIAGESEKAARQIEAITARSNSDIVKSRGAELAAATRAKGAEALSSAVQQQTAKDQADKQFAESSRHTKVEEKLAYGQLGVAQGHLGIAARSLDETIRHNKADEQAALLAASMKGSGKDAETMFKLSKENEERGIGDVSTGELLLRPEGQKMVDEAKKYDNQATAMRSMAGQVQDPTKRQQILDTASLYEQKGSQMRGEATIQYAFRGKSPDQAAKLSQQYSGAQTAISLIDDVKALRDKYGPSWLTTSDGQAAMKAKGVALMMQLKNAWQLGVLSESDQKLLDQATGGDPTKFSLGDVTTFLDSHKGPEASLDAISDSIEKQVRNDFRTAGYNGELTIKRTKPAGPETPEDKATKNVLADRTYQENIDAQKPGTARKVLEFLPTGIAMKGMGIHSDDAKAAAEAAPSSGYGLSADQQASVNSLIKATEKSKDPAAAEARLLSLATSDRESVRNGVLNTLRDRSPTLYKKALATLPIEERQVREASEASKIRPARLGTPGIPELGIKEQSTAQVMASEPVDKLKQAALMGDMASKQELARRVGLGDRAARQAVHEVIVSTTGRP